jgi:hypothetical protein
MRNLPFCAASLALQLPALPSCSAPKLNSIRNGNLQSICRSVPRFWRCSCQRSRHAPPQSVEMAICNQSAVLCGILALQLPALPSCSAPKLNRNWQSQRQTLSNELLFTKIRVKFNQAIKKHFMLNQKTCVHKNLTKTLFEQSFARGFIKDGV